MVRSRILSQKRVHDSVLLLVPENILESPLRAENRIRRSRPHPGDEPSHVRRVDGAGRGEELCDRVAVRDEQFNQGLHQGLGHVFGEVLDRVIEARRQLRLRRHLLELVKIFLHFGQFVVEILEFLRRGRRGFVQGGIRADAKFEPFWDDVEKEEEAAAELGDDEEGSQICSIERIGTVVADVAILLLSYDMNEWSVVVVIIGVITCWGNFHLKRETAARSGLTGARASAVEEKQSNVPNSRSSGVDAVFVFNAKPVDVLDIDGQASGGSEPLDTLIEMLAETIFTRL